MSFIPIIFSENKHFIEALYNVSLLDVIHGRVNNVGKGQLLIDERSNQISLGLWICYLDEIGGKMLTGHTGKIFQSFVKNVSFRTFS